MDVTLGVDISVMGTKRISKDRLDNVIKEHAQWLENHEQGKRADLSNYNLRKFKLQQVNLSYANLTGTCFFEADLHGANLSHADLNNANFDDADLSEAILDKADLYRASICHANLYKVEAEQTNFTSCIMWNSNFKEASVKKSNLLGAELCDCDFESADLSECELYCTNIDYTSFNKANLKNAHLTYADNSFWASFEGADLTGVDFSDCTIDDDAIKDSKGFFIPMICPEEGSFIAWKKCRDNKIAKLLIPEDALRTGGTWYDCRASEAMVLDILDGDNSCSEAVCLRDDTLTFHKGETIKDKEEFDNSLLHDGPGIHFFLSKLTAEMYQQDVSGAEEE